MPDFYAHYRQGQHVFSLLPEKIRSLVSNKNLYDIGLQGPDFLYYYKPLQTSGNPILQLAADIHDGSGSSFFTAAQNAADVKPETDEFSYLMGCIGHFGLDSCGHPYVNRMVAEMDFDHVEMEIEFDKFLLLRDGLDPFFYKAHRRLNLSVHEAQAVAHVYRGVFSAITAGDIERAFNTFRYGKRFFYSPSKISQRFKFYLLRRFGLYESLQGHIMKTVSNPKSTITNAGLLKCYEGSIKITQGLMENFCEYIVHRTPLSGRFNLRFA
ncbi:MAG: hypothetical protein P1P65_08750 [Treponema sp.]